MLDLTAITSALGSGVSDVLAGGLIVVGAVAGVWGIKNIIDIFSKDKSTFHPMPKYNPDVPFSVNDSPDDYEKRLKDHNVRKYGVPF